MNSKIYVTILIIFITISCSKNSKALRLAKNARKKFGYGTRKVPKTKL